MIWQWAPSVAMWTQWCGSSLQDTQKNSHSLSPFTSAVSLDSARRLGGDKRRKSELRTHRNGRKSSPQCRKHCTLLEMGLTYAFLATSQPLSGYSNQNLFLKKGRCVRVKALAEQGEFHSINCIKMILPRRSAHLLRS